MNKYRYWGRERLRIIVAWNIHLKKLLILHPISSTYYWSFNDTVCHMSSFLKWWPQTTVTVGFFPSQKPEIYLEKKLKSYQSLIKCTQQQLLTMQITCTMVDLYFSYLAHSTWCAHMKIRLWLYSCYIKSRLFIWATYFQILTTGSPCN